MTVTLSRLNHCTEFNEMWHGYISFLETLHLDNQHPRRRSRGQKLVKYKHHNTQYIYFFFLTTREYQGMLSVLQGKPT